MKSHTRCHSQPGQPAEPAVRINQIVQSDPSDVSTAVLQSCHGRRCVLHADLMHQSLFA